MAWDLDGGGKDDGRKVEYPQLPKIHDSKASPSRSSLIWIGGTGLGGFGN